MSLKTFTGFRGVALLAEVDLPATLTEEAGSVQFVIIAHDAEDLAAIYAKLLPEAAPFNPAACQKSVMIQASILPELKTL